MAVKEEVSGEVLESDEDKEDVEGIGRGRGSKGSKNEPGEILGGVGSGELTRAFKGGGAADIIPLGVGDGS